MNKIDKAYTDLLQDILDSGVKKETRNGGTISVFGRQIRHKMSDGFPLLTTKKMAWKTMVTELLWFLRGDTNIKFLVDNGCYIWDGDAYKNYCEKINLPPTRTLPLGTKVIPTLYTQEEFINKIKTDDEFAEKWGELGPIYGKQWREWSNYRQVGIDPFVCEYRKEDPTDQIANLINDLKTNPDSRRLMVNAWNVGELEQCVLPPCHYGFQVYTRELSDDERIKLFTKITNPKGYEGKIENTVQELLTMNNIPTRTISLMFNMRSIDTFLGLPFNIASYGLLLEIIAKAVNMVPDELIGNLGDVHLYSNHVEQAKEQIGRELSLEERKQIFEERGYVCDVWPFNGDWSGEYDGFGIPTRTREPYPLPTLKINSGNENWHLLDIDDIVYSLDNELTFKLENYQSHPSIKAPLSN
jgi:thymidylate synthase